MDRALWQQHLAIAERHVILARRIVAAQKQVLSELRRDGHPTHMAQRILQAYEELLRLHVEDRDRLKKDLANRAEDVGGWQSSPAQKRKRLH